jgi:hypothetical protein
MRRLLSTKVSLGTLALLSVGATMAQDCPCWTEEQLAAIPVDPWCWCQNDLNLTNPFYWRCTTINVNSDHDDGECSSFRNETGGYVVVRGSEYPGEDLECLRYDAPTQPGVWEFLTEEEARICAMQIAERAAVAEPPPTCSATAVLCAGDADCPNPIGLCSIAGNICASGVDCPDVGGCSATGEICENDDDCPGTLNFCFNLEPQTCEFHENLCRPEPNCLDECYPPECRIQARLEAPDTVRVPFTNQRFNVAHGTLSELRTDGDYARADCTTGLYDEYTDTQPLSPGSGRYYLLRANLGFSCTDHGDSGLTPDPRDAVDDVCPP